VAVNIEAKFGELVASRLRAMERRLRHNVSILCCTIVFGVVTYSSTLAFAMKVSTIKFLLIVVSMMFPDGQRALLTHAQVLDGRQMCEGLSGERA
jgi:hypothetical protein